MTPPAGWVPLLSFVSLPSRRMHDPVTSSRASTVVSPSRPPGLDGLPRPWDGGYLTADASAAKAGTALSGTSMGTNRVAGNK